MRKERQDHVAEEIAQDPSTKNIWRIVNKIAKPGPPVTDIILEEEGQLVEEKEKVVEIFSDFFIKKIESLREGITQDVNNDPVKRLDDRIKMNNNKPLFTLKTVTEKKLKKIINAIKKKKSHGFDDISSELLRTSSDVLCLPLRYIINLSILKGEFPDSWKTSIIKPLLKKGSPKIKNNYRPISLLSVPSMILERVVKEQIEEYMEKNKFLGDNQFGFRANRSTTGAILAMHSKWSIAADKGKSTGILLYDLSAAFDCLDVDILCKKLRIYGFDIRSIAWITSYLTGRKQVVQIGGHSSRSRSLPFGSPQGSCLSPLLFIILVSDMEDWTDYSDLFGFADDTTDSVEGEAVSSVMNLLEEDAENILNFMSANKLVINPGKTTFLLNKPKGGETEPLSIRVGDANVVESQSGKLLGMTISSNLQWVDHINDMKQALHYRLFLLRRLRGLIPENSLTQVTEAIFNSKLRYGISAYAKLRLGECDKKNGNMNSLQVLQNDAMRIITGTRRSDRTSTCELLDKTGFMSVNQMAVQHTAGEVYNLLNYNSESEMNHLFTEIKRSSTVQTRSLQENKINTVPFKHVKLEGFMQQGAKVWNALPLDIKNSNTKSAFKRKVKTWSKNLPI